ncbi:MAG: endonuclease III domain-containing protein [Vampirovibrionales bacterium]
MMSLPIRKQSVQPKSDEASKRKRLSKKQEARLLEIRSVIETLDATYVEHPLGDLTEGQPYRTLIGCLISLRTKDEVTIPASERLFALADTPEAMVTLSLEAIEQAIYPCGFYRNKAKTIIEVSQALLEHHAGHVPDSIDELLILKGVGRKTANLVVGLGHLKPAICVDIHVHRICNRLGWVNTKTPDDTEFALRDLLPVELWQPINRVMVLHGRECCKPIGARCDTCPVQPQCLQRDVKKRRPPPSL